MVEKYKAMCF